MAVHNVMILRTESDWSADFTDYTDSKYFYVNDVCFLRMMAVDGYAATHSYMLLRILHDRT